MRPILFRFFDRPVHSYPVMLYIGIVLGIETQLLAARSIGIDSMRVLVATLGILSCAMIGARVLHVVVHWADYRQRPLEMLRFARGGASMYGGLAFAVAISPPLLAWLRLPFAVYWDLAAFTLVIGTIVTRIGCMLQGCCAGRAASGWWACNLPDHEGVWRPRIPTQLMESAWSTIVLGGAVVVWYHLPFHGAVFIWVAGAYAAGRIVLEPMRAEQERVKGISVQQAISIAIVGMAIAAFASRG